MKPTLSAMDKLRDMVEYFNQRDEIINDGFKTVSDILRTYNYEMENGVLECGSNDEKLYHAEMVNCMLGYKVYSATQTVKNGKVSKPNYANFHP
jgi:hypothetical protein